ncbi:MAG: hypothetical protein RIR51_927 [Bacteroidota bacterium]
MKLIKVQEKLMGNSFSLGVLSEKEEKAQFDLNLAISEIKRIEKLFTTFDESSQVNMINQGAGLTPVKVDREILQLIHRSIKISELTQGAFDISYGSLDKNFWNFNRAMKELPKPEDALKSVELINYKNIELNFGDSTVFLKKKGMRIGFGGIGKGYAADSAQRLLKELGYENGVVNASGDLCAWGKDEGNKPWQIGIINPDDKNKVLGYVNLNNSSTATSGNYEKFVIIKGIKYSHTINPKTGFPVKGIKSVTIFAPTAELSDVLTTPVLVMGKEVGLDLINQIKGVECILIDDNNKIFTSKNINFHS